MGMKAVDNMGFVPEGGGRLISARQLVLHTEAFSLGDELELHIDWSASVGALESFDGWVLRAGEELARASFHLLRIAPLEPK